MLSYLTSTSVGDAVDRLPTDVMVKGGVFMVQTLLLSSNN